MTTWSGVSFPIASSLREVALPGELPAELGAIDHLFVDSTGALRIAIAHGPIDAIARAGLPASSGPLPQAYAEGFAAGMNTAARKIELFAIKAGGYDKVRQAFSVHGKTRSPSQAKLLLDEPDTSPSWREVERAGIDLQLARCLLQAFLETGGWATPEQLRARAGTTATRCGVTPVYVEKYLSNVGAALFAPALSSMTSIAVVTKSAVVTIMVLGPHGRERDVEALAGEIWKNVSVSASARVEDITQSEHFQNGQLIGIILGSSLFVLAVGAALGWILVKLRMPPLAAAAVSFGLQVVLVALAVLSASDATRFDWAKLITYVLTSALAFGPVSRWLSSKGPRVPPRKLEA